MIKHRNHHSAEFKAKVAIEALSEAKTLADFSTKSFNQTIRYITSLTIREMGSHRQTQYLIAY